jgi:hypothetical protein
VPFPVLCRLGLVRPPKNEQNAAAGGRPRRRPRRRRVALHGRCGA